MAASHLGPRMNPFNAIPSTTNFSPNSLIWDGGRAGSFVLPCFRLGSQAGRVWGNER